MSQVQLLNSASIETPQGFRNFQLFLGGVENSEDEVIAFSTHANVDLRPTGAALKALEERYGSVCMGMKPLLVPSPPVGCYEASTPSRRFLIVRIPGERNAKTLTGESMELYELALWSLFGSLAALELRDRGCRSLGMSLLGGARGYPVDQSMNRTLQAVANWLKASRSTCEVNLFIVDSDLGRQWAQSLDQVLGRRVFKSSNDELLEGLRCELLAHLARVNQEKASLDGVEKWRSVLVSLVGAKELCFQRVATAGRTMAEFVTIDLLRVGGLTCNANLYQKITALRQSGTVAPWMVNYLMSLKDFGNDQVHNGPSATYKPTDPTREDMVALLSSMVRVLQIWLDCF